MRTKLEEDFKKIGMDIGGKDFAVMAYCMPKVIEDSIKIKEVTRVSVDSGDMLVVHIDTKDLSESVIRKVSYDLKKLYGKDVKIMICNERTRVEVVKKNSKRKRTYRKTKKEIGIWRA